MQELTATTALESIQTTTPDPEVRTTRRIEVGSAIHQGDVYLHRVPDDHPRGARLGTRQVAVGTTIGSRHVAEGDGVEVFAGVAYPTDFVEPDGLTLGAMRGPVVVAPQGLTLTHPEHAHHVLPAGVYQVTYQCDMSTMRAVVD